MDITRDGGPASAQTLFDFTNVSNFHVSGCNFVGGPSGGSALDIAFLFKSTSNSSSNIICGCHFEGLTTVIQIVGTNGTVGLTTFGIHLGNVPIASAILDPTPPESGNQICFITSSQSGTPSGVGNSKDHVFAGLTGNVLFRVNNVNGAANFIRHLPATASNPPTLVFDGTDNVVNGVIQTKGGSLFFNAAGQSGSSVNLLSLVNVAGAVNWIVVQNAVAGGLSLLQTSSGGMAIAPKGALWLSPAGGLFVSNLPTVKPVAGTSQVWNNAGVLSIA